MPKKTVDKLDSITQMTNRNEKIFAINNMGLLNELKVDENVYIINNKSILKFCDNYISLKYLSFRRGFLNLEFVYYDLNNPDVIFKIKDDLDNFIEPYYYKKISTPHNLKYNGVLLNDSTVVKFRIDTSNIKHLFLGFFSNGIFYKDANLDMNWRLPFVLKEKKLRYFDSFNKRLSVWYDNSCITIDRKTKFNFIYKIKSFITVALNRRELPFFRFLKFSSKYILVYERPQKAGDNSEAIYEYIKKNHFCESKHIYFVIDSKSEDYLRLKQYGNIVNFGSFKHKYLFLNSRMVITSHTNSSFYKIFLHNEQSFADLLQYQLFWVQHGVVIADLSKLVNKYQHSVDRMLVSTYGEQREFLSDRYCYNKENVLLTGLPRFDKLVDGAQNLITIAPTWRRELSGKVKSDGTHSVVDNFETSDYYINYKDLLTNSKLLKLIEENDFRVNFVLHHGVENYREYFKRLETDRIKVISAFEANYSQIFRESKLLITDYSSIFNDFAYLKKPEILFQFDANIYFKTHYTNGYFDYKKDGYGPVVYNIPDLMKKIEFYFQNGFQMEKKYQSNVMKAFPYIDQNNCKRVYEEILKLDQE